jgi:hypothetical protein
LLVALFWKEANRYGAYLWLSLAQLPTSTNCLNVSWAKDNSFLSGRFLRRRVVFYTEFAIYMTLYAYICSYVQYWLKINIKY